jgi:2-succinyl-5-enolpyruvyl-6-hydroxy-3-cyclohexene-1-carboxylate synthase
MSSDLHSAWARLFVRALADAGVHDVVMSPGSRSTPIVLALDAVPSLRVHVFVDERVAAFFALGQARATGIPSVLLCTSGTAGAHWLPAIIEASLMGVPLVCITADRPWEAYDCASPQTIDQTDLFGRHVRHRAELGAPVATVAALRAVTRIAAQAVHRARGPVPGPVHINARFRKPLEPVPTTAPEPWEPLLSALLERGPTRVHPPALFPSQEALSDLAASIRTAQRPWVVCGPAHACDPRPLRAALIDLCRATGAVLLAEATSGVRFGIPDDVLTLPSFDALLRVPSFVERLAPDLIIELGLPPTSSAYASWVESHDPPRHLVAPFGWPDPHGSARSLTLADPAVLCHALVQKLEGHRPTHGTLAWGAATREAQRLATVAIASCDDGTLHEGHIPSCLVASLPPGATLLVGNSLPARDIDTFTVGKPSAALRVFHQRGASGIDGLLAGAAGTRSVTPLGHPVVLYLGDLSTQHDLGGLDAVARARGTLLIVAVNNQGGRIFEGLPLGRMLAAGRTTPDTFTARFITPPSVSLADVARANGVEATTIDTREHFARAFATALASGSPCFLEVCVDPASGRTLRDRVHAAVAEALAR